MTLLAAAALVLLPPIILWWGVKHDRMGPAWAVAALVGVGLWWLTGWLAASEIEDVRAALRDAGPHEWAKLPAGEQTDLHNGIRGQLASGRLIAAAANVGAMLAATLCTGIMLRTAYRRARSPRVSEDDVA